MLHWLHKKVSVINYTIRVSVGMACVIHVLFFLACYCVQINRQKMIVQINYALKDLTIPVIIIDPYAKTVGLQHGTSTHIAINNKKTVGTSSQASRSTIAKVTKKNAKTPVVQSTKKTMINKPQATAKAASKKETTKKTPTKKLEPKKNIKKSTIAKKKDTPPVKKQELKPIQKEKSNKAVQALPEIPIEKATVAATTQHDISACQEGPILVARSSQEAAALTVQIQIQQELLRVWHPPLGIDDSAMCKMQLKIDAAGCIEQIDMMQSSGTLLFDVSARAAVQQALWPHAVWGTTLELILQ